MLNQIIQKAKELEETINREISQTQQQQTRRTQSTTDLSAAPPLPTRAPSAMTIRSAGSSSPQRQQHQSPEAPNPPGLDQVPHSRGTTDGDSVAMVQEEGDELRLLKVSLRQKSNKLEELKLKLDQRDRDMESMAALISQLQQQSHPLQHLQTSETSDTSTNTENIISSNNHIHKNKDNKDAAADQVVVAASLMAGESGSGSGAGERIELFSLQEKIRELSLELQSSKLEVDSLKSVKGNSPFVWLILMLNWALEVLPRCLGVIPEVRGVRASLSLGSPGENLEHLIYSIDVGENERLVSQHEEKMKKVKQLFAAAQKQSTEQKDLISQREQTVQELSASLDELKHQYEAEQKAKVKVEADVRRLEEAVREAEAVAKVKQEATDRQLERSRAEYTELLAEFTTYKTRAFALLQQAQQQQSSPNGGVTSSTDRVAELEAHLHRLHIDNAAMKRVAGEREARIKELETLIKTSFDQHRAMESEVQTSRREREMAEEAANQLRRDREVIEADYTERIYNFPCFNYSDLSPS
jgi:hypothetical protein